ncbi:23S rRNA (adenine(1618)-N(6))-methyltransferase RlmF [Vibrio tritonius]|uniref:23S rRNA (adenine(1618)-N(6))-methyltransferase RlmF n=1 Tax=Vibrio tritonius TaxID=1435069 RepID=UPI0009EA2F32
MSRSPLINGIPADQFFKQKQKKRKTLVGESLSDEQKQAQKRAKRAAAKGKRTKQAQRSKSSLNVKVITSSQGLHPRNRHRGQYDFAALCQALPELRQYVVKNPAGQDTIAFADPNAVKCLNKALLAHHYQVTQWDIPEGYLCPPIPGRADYIHRAAELLQNESPELELSAVTMLDIGVGANCIYPIIAAVDYGWQVKGSDIDPISVKQANLIVQSNSVLKGKIECQLQTNSQSIFSGIIGGNDRFVLTTCNPPFHRSLEEAQKGTEQKRVNLANNAQKRSGAKAKPNVTSGLNFGGQKAELWCPGGEAAFLQKMARESALFKDQVLWFSSLISKKENVRWMRKQLEQVGAVDARVVEMAQGQKISRFIAWSFQNASQRKDWLKQKC